MANSTEEVDAMTDEELKQFAEEMRSKNSEVCEEKLLSKSGLEKIVNGQLK